MPVPIGASAISTLKSFSTILVPLLCFILFRKTLDLLVRICLFKHSSTYLGKRTGGISKEEIHVVSGSPDPVPDSRISSASCVC